MACTPKPLRRLARKNLWGNRFVDRMITQVLAEDTTRLKRKRKGWRKWYATYYMPELRRMEIMAKRIQAQAKERAKEL